LGNPLEKVHDSDVREVAYAMSSTSNDAVLWLLVVILIAMLVTLWGDQDDDY
jgi:hypothetical protein